MVYHIYSSLIILILSGSLYGQKPIDPQFDRELKTLLEFSVSIISVSEAHQHFDKYIFLDAREKEEYDVSHIPGAHYIGYDHFSPDYMTDIHKDSQIIIYCSVGYRSEKLGERLLRMGYKNVQNLYGSIFEWSNQGLALENNQAVSTDSLHTYNRRWSQWVNHPEVIKVW